MRKKLATTFIYLPTKSGEKLKTGGIACLRCSPMAAFCTKPYSTDPYGLSSESTKGKEQ